MTKHIEGLEKVIVVLNDNNKYEIKVYWNEKKDLEELKNVKD